MKFPGRKRFEKRAEMLQRMKERKRNEWIDQRLCNSVQRCADADSGLWGCVFIKDPRKMIYAIEHGYRNLDTATDYGNENVVGEAVKNCGLDRKELFITTKVWNSMHGYDKTMKAFDFSVKQLQTDYIDLYLIHWPCPNHNLYVDTWKAMEQLYKEGRIRAIGVANFYEEWLERIKEECEIVPMVNQVEYNPYNQHVELRKYCEANNIQIEAYTPICRGAVNEDATIQKIAAKYAKSCVQVTIRFLFQERIPLFPGPARRNALSAMRISSILS